MASPFRHKSSKIRVDRQSSRTRKRNILKKNLVAYSIFSKNFNAVRCHSRANKNHKVEKHFLQILGLLSVKRSFRTFQELYLTELDKILDTNSAQLDASMTLKIIEIGQVSEKYCNTMS